MPFIDYFVAYIQVYIEKHLLKIPGCARIDMMPLIGLWWHFIIIVVPAIQTTCTAVRTLSLDSVNVTTENIMIDIQFVFMMKGITFLT